MGSGAHKVDIPLDVDGIILKVEVLPAQAEGLASPQAAVIQDRQQQPVRMALDGHQHMLPLPVGQRAPGFLFLRLRTDQRDAGVAWNDPVSVSALHDRFKNSDHDGDLRLAQSGKGINEHL